MALIPQRGIVTMNLRTILYPTDFSEPSHAALHYAVQLAHDYGARLIVLHAVETLGPENVTYGEAVSQPQPASYRQRLWEDLHRIQAPDSQVPVEYVLSEDEPVTAILHTAATNECDLIVLGSHGRHGLWRLLGGSVAERVVREAACPVLVVKRASPNSKPVSEEGDELHPRNLTEKNP
jgi:nucleotide-binding universal stress UspA family protein